MSNTYIPPKPSTQKKRFLARILTGAKACYLSNFIDKSYSMKMGQIWAPGRNIFMPNTHELIRKIMVTDSVDYPKSDILDKILVLLIGNGLFVANGDEWKRQRRIIDPAFAHAKLKRVFPAMWSAVSDLLDRMDKRKDGEILAVDDEMTHITADVIFRTMFSVKLEQGDSQKLFQAFSDFQNPAFSIGFVQALGLPNPFFIKSYKARKAAKTIRALIEPFARDRYERHHRGEELETDDILTTLVKSVDPETGEYFSIEELINQTAFLFLAGHETSSSALSWTLFLIAQVPDVQERIFNEVTEVLGDRAPVYDDIRNLKFVRNVFQETLRLYPPVGFLPREASKCTHMRGKEVKPGDMMVVSPWLMHRNPNYWDNPDGFDPDRYDDGACKESLRNAYFPFSLGPRICTGTGFAKQEAMIVLSSLIRNYRFEAVPEHVPVPIGRLTVCSENGIRLRVFRR